MQMFRTIGSTRPRERGVALAMALIFLLILTLIGVTAMSTTSLQERMAGNMQDKNVAFQAAESALLAGENWLRPLSAMPVFNQAVTNDGLHWPSTAGIPIWESVDWDNDTDIVDYEELPGAPGIDNPSTEPLIGVNNQPRYLIEDLGPARDPFGSLKLGTPSPSTRNLFRITAHGTGGTAQAVVEVQSVFEKAF